MKIKIFAASIFVLLGLAFYQFPQFETLNLKALDIFQKGHEIHPDIVILAVDNKSLQKIGRWPWSRKIHAELIEKLKPYQPALVGVDIIFSESEDKISDELLGKSIKEAKFPIVLATEAVFVKDKKEPARVILPLEAFIDSVSLGHTNLNAFSDGIVRSFPQSKTFNNTEYLPFSLLVAKLLNTQISDGEFLINFSGPAGSFQIFSISDFLEGQLPKEKLENKIILIGATAASLHDTVLVPQKNPVMSGVELNANVLDNILLGRQITLLPKVISLSLGLIILGFFIYFYFKLSSKLLSYSLIFIIFALPALSYILWQFGFALTFLTNILFVAVIFVSHAIYRWYISEAEKRKIRETFKHYFSPAIMEEILKNPKSLELGGQRREVTILFSDIRDFTTITEKLPPEKLTQLLQEYFTQMTEEILKTDGVLDKFIGDAIMAFWGAPIEQKDHADKAVKAGINMIKKLKILQKKWLKEGLPLIDAGVGINTGVVTVGNMGSSTRFDYTLIGDDVNAAARLEGLNKEFKTNIIISEATKNKLTTPVSLKSLGSVLVKGKTKPIKIYSIP